MRDLKFWVAGLTHLGEQQVNPPLHCICIPVRRVLQDKVSLPRSQAIALISDDSLAMA